jgi:16S rRNA (uracil1498-N3)-methyltransferase
VKRFFSSIIQANQAILQGSEKEHCVKVLRTQIGETIEVVDGKGSLFIGKLIASDKVSATIQIDEKIDNLTQLPLVSIAICIPKNPSRWEWFLEKATEIGVHQIIPIITKRSEKGNIRKERSEQIILSAFKQAGHIFLPILKEPMPLQKLLLSSENENKLKFIAHCVEEQKHFLADKYKKGENALILIGPEGDFSSEEINLAIKNGFWPVTLGNSRLRVETAGVVAVGIINWMNN